MTALSLLGILVGVGAFFYGGRQIIYYPMDRDMSVVIAALGWVLFWAALLFGGWL